MYCEYCGKKLGEHDSYCQNCGAKVGKETNSVDSEEKDNLSPKSRIVAGVLGILFGGLGIHNFYLGYNTRAVIQLLMTIIGSFLIIPPIAASIWGFVEGIIYLVDKTKTDPNGRKLID